MSRSLLSFLSISLFLVSVALSVRVSAAPDPTCTALLVVGDQGGPLLAPFSHSISIFSFILLRVLVHIILPYLPVFLHPSWGSRSRLFVGRSDDTPRRSRFAHLHHLGTGVPPSYTSSIQLAVAESMARVAESLNVSLVVGLGDNFYERGVAADDDLRFHATFEAVYLKYPALSPPRVPWRVVAGACAAASVARR